MATRHATVMLGIVVMLGGCKDCGEKAPEPVEPKRAEEGDRPPTDLDAPPAATPPTTAPAPQVWTRSGAQPADDALVQALQSDGEPGETALVGEAEDLGDGRYFRLAVRGPRILALLVSENEGQAQVEARVPMPVEMLSTKEGPVQVLDVELGDLEADEEEELLVTVSYHTHPTGGGGGSTRQQKVVLDLEPVIRVAFTVLTGVAPTEGAGAVTEAQIAFEDRNGDDHADVVLTGKQCIASACEPMDVVYYYNPASDSWAEKI